jgi:hypothetical protein
LALETIEELVDYGVVKVREGPEGRYFSPADMKVLTIAKEFLKYGVEPRHLRIFTQFVTREASFIEQIVRPQLQHKDPNAKRNALKELENLIGLSQMFIQTILRQALAAYLPRAAVVAAPGEESTADRPEGVESNNGNSAEGANDSPVRNKSAEMFPE